MDSEKEKIIYEQNYESFRSLNNLMWKVPAFAMTLTGGVWIGVASIDITTEVRLGLLILSALANICFIFVLFRVRRVMEKYLVDIRMYESRESNFGYLVVIIFSILLFAAFLGNFYAIINIDSVFG